ncbi:hypothetical protein CANARDRAFT_26145 [[Candida] arabinofermentans NRRL YB-2248]|uniref:Ubiquitin carboxyl-terminal hydrolase n=1 Tax=[Candida] arabinofermentans NRRL YB-2248 TaxID=983967 RepID=A0A1E4T890_9ASCO|nr:hypothetical protein CANARDRAFT_26145 [[Candida] arabinofermentans NRRL YB-2248]
MFIADSTEDHKSLLELTKLVDELVDADGRSLSSVEYLTKSLDCIQSYKANCKPGKTGSQNETTPRQDEESFMYYTAASKILSEIIPSQPDFTKFKQNRESGALYNDMIHMLSKERGNYELIRARIKKITETKETDNLLLRFQSLKNGSSGYSTPSPSPPPRPHSHSHSIPTEFQKLPMLDISNGNSVSSSKLSQLFDQASESFKEFDDKEFITINDISSLLETFPDKILLIDLRRKREYEIDHIRLTDNVIQIEPVSIREGYSCEDVERYSLSTNSDEERNLFAKRANFELIILFDQSSTRFKKSVELERFVSLLKFNHRGKPLKRNPVILEGGFNEWSHFKNSIKSPMDYAKPLLNDRRDSVSSNVSHEDLIVRRTSSYNESHLIKNMSEYLSKPKSTTIPHQESPVQTKRRSSSTMSYHKSPSPSQLKSTNHYSTSPSKPKPVFYSPVSSPQQQPQQQQHQLNNHLDSRFGPPPQLPPMPLQQQPLVSTISNPSTSSNATLINGNGQMANRNGDFKESLYVITGLVNLGNSCYMNSALQCVIGSRKLVEFFINGSFRKHININSKLGSKGILANEFYSLLSELYGKSSHSRPGSLAPLHFRRILGSLNSLFKNAEQQDCSEFLNYILDSLHEDLNENGNHPKLAELTKEEEAQRELLPIRVASTIEWERYLKTNFSVIVDIFQGQMLSQLKCLTCGTTSTTYNAFSTISLPIPVNTTQTTLSACFDEFVKPELLTGDDAWTCPKCQKKQRSLKLLKISRLPQVLIVHVKRFKLDNYLTKLNTFIDYPLEMNLDHYWPGIESNLERLQLSKLPTRGQIPPFKYRLSGVVNHYGNLVNGHYTSFVDKGPGNGWCLFDDDKVYKNCPTNKVVNGDAYILFYVRV